MTGPERSSDDDLVPLSVRLGEVVPPEDPEDWSRPLTWVAALGMLAAPAVALGWFALAPPNQGTTVLPATLAVAIALAGGAVTTGATQQGIGRAMAATVAAGLFAALVVVALGVVMAGERQVGVASHTLSHAVGAAAGGVAGAAAGSLVAAAAARLWTRPTPFVIALATSIVVALVTVATLMPEATKA
jgi:hypothetical protein